MPLAHAYGGGRAGDARTRLDYSRERPFPNGDFHGRCRDRGHTRAAGRQAAARRLAGAARPHRGSGRRLADSAGHIIGAGVDRRHGRRMVLRANERSVARAPVLSWRRLLLRLDRQSPPNGDRSGPRGARPRACDSIQTRARASVSRRLRRRARGLAISARAGICPGADRDRRRQRGRRTDACLAHAAA